MGQEYFIKVPMYLFEQGKYLTAAAFRVYVALLSFQNQRTGKTFPAYPAIMERTGMGRNAVADALNELEQFYWIERTRKFGQSNKYKLGRPSLDGETAVCPTQEEQLMYQQALSAKKHEKRRDTVKPWHHSYRPAESRIYVPDDEDDDVPF
jgi:hypothetical protein